MAQKMIVIVEDDLVFSDMLKKELEQAGYKVCTATEGREGLNIMKEKGADLVVLDVIIPEGMDGFQCLKEMKKTEEFASIPTVVVTGRSAMKDTFLALGAEKFFAKPVSPEDFIKEVNEILINRIIILCEDSRAKLTVGRGVEKYDYVLDTPDTPEEFLKLVNEHAYELMVVQLRLKDTTADKLIEQARQIPKNKETPAIVFPKVMIKEGDEAMAAASIIDNCRKLAKCTYMDKGFNYDKFMEAATTFISLT